MSMSIVCSENEGLAWLRYALTPIGNLPKISNWSSIFDFADKQKVIEVCDPTKFDIPIGIETLSLWIGNLQQIKNTSLNINKRVEKLCDNLEKDGLRCCILKGQGNAELYPEPLMRMPGDIDVWIDSDEEFLYNYVRNLYPDAKITFKHSKRPIFTSCVAPG